MYISRVKIDYNNKKALRELDHLGVYHSWVEDSFPEEVGNNRSRKLWRIDRLNEEDYLLVVSEDRPDLQILERFGVRGSAETKEYSRFLDSLKNGQRMKFRLVVNPTRSIARPGKRGRVVPITSEEDQLEYLLDRSEKNGFDLDPGDFYLLKSEFKTARKRGEFNIDYISAEFQGELTITDSDQFVNMLKTGIGRKKAYGFGMMTVLPAE